MYSMVSNLKCYPSMYSICQIWKEMFSFTNIYSPRYARVLHRFCGAREKWSPTWSHYTDNKPTVTKATFTFWAILSPTGLQIIKSFGWPFQGFFRQGNDSSIRQREFGHFLSQDVMMNNSLGKKFVNFGVLQEIFK